MKNCFNIFEDTEIYNKKLHTKFQFFIYNQIIAGRQSPNLTKMSIL